MNEDISHPHEVAPGNTRVPFCEIRWQRTSRFPDDFDITDHGILSLPIRQKAFIAHPFGVRADPSRMSRRRSLSCRDIDVVLLDLFLQSALDCRRGQEIDLLAKN